MAIFGKKKTSAAPDYGAMKSVSKVSGDYSLTSSEAIYAAVARISNTVAMLPLHLYKDYEVAKDHPLEKLVSYMPNAAMTPYIFKQTMEAFRNTEGNCYALKVLSAAGQVERLDVLDASQVTVQRATETGEIWYSFPMNGQTAMVHSSNVIALRHMSANGEKGIKPLDVLRNTLNYNENIRQFSLAQLEGANNGILLEMPAAAAGNNATDALVNKFIETYKKSGHKVMVLEGGIKATTLTMPALDSKALDVERITKNRVATVYQIPPHMLGDYTDATYSTAEQSNQEFLDLTILPIVTQWQEELNLKLLTYEQIKDGYEFRFDLSAMKKADVAATAEKYQKAVRGGWMSVNEVRRREGLPPDESGDTLMLSKDLAPLSAVKEGASV